MKVVLSGGHKLINPPEASKINAAQLIGFGATLAAAAWPDLIPLIDAAQNPEVQTAVVAGVGIVTQLVTVVLRTFFTGR